MAVSRAGSVERSRRAGSLTACRPCVAWLSNDVPVCRDLAVAWLKRGASAGEIPGMGRARHGPCPRSGTGGGEPMVAVMIGVDPHEASHTAVAIGATGESLAELRVCASESRAERLLAW